MKLTSGHEVKYGRRGFAVELESPHVSVAETYRTMRANGGTAAGCMRCARTWEAWEQMPEDSVRLLYVADEDHASALDWLDQSAAEMGVRASEWEAIGKAERARAADAGVWTLVGEYRNGRGAWVHADSVGGFVAEDGCDMGDSAADIAEETMRARAEHLASKCQTCGRFA